MNSGIIEAIFRVGILIQTLSQMAARPSGLANPYKTLSRQISFGKKVYKRGHNDILIGRLSNDNGTTSRVAVKFYRKDIDSRHASGPAEKSKFSDELMNELMIWHQLDHPNILKFIGIVINENGVPGMVSPHCEKGTVTKYLKRFKPDSLEHISILQGIADGLQYLHKHEIVHNNLQPNKIIIDDDGHPLLSGFEFSYVNTWDVGSNRRDAVEVYLAPERLLGPNQRPNKASDIYSLGLIFSEIWIDSKSFQNVNQAFVALVVDRKMPTCPANAPRGTDLVWGLFEECWAQEPAARPTIEDVVQRLGDIHFQIIAG